MQWNSGHASPTFRVLSTRLTFSALWAILYHPFLECIRLLFCVSSLEIYKVSILLVPLSIRFIQPFPSRLFLPDPDDLRKQAFPDFHICRKKRPPVQIFGCPNFSTKHSVHWSNYILEVLLPIQETWLLFPVCFRRAASDEPEASLHRLLVMPSWHIGKVRVENFQKD